MTNFVIKYSFGLIRDRRAAESALQILAGICVLLSVVILGNMFLFDSVEITPLLGEGADQ